MKKSFFILFIMIAMLQLLLGCSSIIYGSRQDLNVTTTPSSAIARVGTQSCITPCTLTISRKERFIFIQQGDIEHQYELTRTRHNFTFLIGNILWGIIPGMIVDSATGAKIDIDDVNIITRDAKLQKGR
jgi:hypothetical protein